jgi:hypothetical protein
VELGGPQSLSRQLDRPVKMQNVTFIDCVFEMASIEMPNEYMKKAAGDLLASQFTSIKRSS